ncbi:SDR family oxidoreductase [Streptomyces physcomitrii]|uniref:SDR family NAD(P)-dependent oxidoreductase n=1 Tax=Streptomyces physcomitrii TaxID=2724184 RepID=UPI003427A523
MSQQQPRARFASRSALVTGGGSGIGRAVALALAAEGASVLVTGRSPEALAETVALVAEAGGTARAQLADVTRAEEMREAVAVAVRHFGSLDVAVNNAGVFRGGPLTELTAEDWQLLLATNVTGVLNCLQAEIRRMRTQPEGGAIVTIGSNLGAHLSHPGTAAYGATKAAVSALTRGAAREHLAEGVRINTVSPGPSATAMSLRPGEGEAERAARMKEESPLGRVSTTAEVAAAVLYLASEEAASVAGADLVIDGGAAA